MTTRKIDSPEALLETLSWLKGEGFRAWLNRQAERDPEHLATVSVADLAVEYIEHLGLSIARDAETVERDRIEAEADAALARLPANHPLRQVQAAVDGFHDHGSVERARRDLDVGVRRAGMHSVDPDTPDDDETPEP